MHSIVVQASSGGSMHNKDYSDNNNKCDPRYEYCGELLTANEITVSKPNLFLGRDQQFCFYLTEFFFLIAKIYRYAPNII